MRHSIGVEKRGGGDGRHICSLRNKVRGCVEEVKRECNQLIIKTLPCMMKRIPFCALQKMDIHRGVWPGESDEIIFRIISKPRRFPNLIMSSTAVSVQGEACIVPPPYFHKFFLSQTSIPSTVTPLFQLYCSTRATSNAES